MPKRTGFSLDTKDFDIKFPIVTDRKIPRAAARGFQKTGAMVIRDSIREEPMVPKSRGVTKEGGRRGQGPGHLRRSQKIERPKIERGEISIEVGFDADYAAVVHEMGVKPAKAINWTLPGTGAKYLEAKLIKNKEEYMKNTADEIKRESNK